MGIKKGMRFLRFQDGDYMRIKGINQNMVLSNVCLAEILINEALPTTQRHAEHAPQKSSLKRFLAWLGAEAIATLK